MAGGLITSISILIINIVTYFLKFERFYLFADSLSACNVQVSDDAGRYVCNYSYFISLEEAEKRRKMFSLFVHVPPFDKVSKETQLECLHKLFELLARCVVEKWEEDPEEEELNEAVAGSDEKKDGNAKVVNKKGNRSFRKLCSIM